MWSVYKALLKWYSRRWPFNSVTTLGLGRLAVLYVPVCIVVTTQRILLACRTHRPPAGGPEPSCAVVPPGPQVPVLRDNGGDLVLTYEGEPAVHPVVAVPDIVVVCEQDPDNIARPLEGGIRHRTGTCRGHYSGVTWAPRRLKSSAIKLFVHQLIYSEKEQGRHQSSTLLVL